MRKVKGKYIRLTEQDLKNLLKSEVLKELQLLNEYAYERKEFVRRVEALLPQIIQNWSLVRCCTILKQDINNCKNHWLEELHAHMNCVIGDSLKKNNSAKHRLSAIRQAFENGDFLESKKISWIIKPKLHKEGICDDKLIEALSNQFVETSFELANVLSNYLVEPTEYLKSI